MYMYSDDIYVPFFNSSSRKIELNSAERNVGGYRVMNQKQLKLFVKIILTFKLTSA